VCLNVWFVVALLVLHIDVRAQQATPQVVKLAGIASTGFTKDS